MKKNGNVVEGLFMISVLISIIQCRYNLAFENSFCKEYIMEKFYENYKYDILQVVRGNTPFEGPINISHDAYNLQMISKMPTSLASS